ncbi:MAG: glutathione peroxidase [Planctomycetota bacterium]
MKIDYSTKIEALDGRETDLEAYRGQTLLIVNTASKCGFTPQLKGLQELHERYQAQGFAVLGFPCNQFLRQEPGDADTIGEFCQRNYGVEFPMHQKIKVNGKDAHPLFRQLKSARRGLLGSSGIKWNFTKFLVGPDGEILARFGPGTKPERIAARIEALLTREAKPS